jgi:hypothetical protein
MLDSEPSITDVDDCAVNSGRTWLFKPKVTTSRKVCISERKEGRKEGRKEAPRALIPLSAKDVAANSTAAILCKYDSTQVFIGWIIAVYALTNGWEE